MWNLRHPLPHLSRKSGDVSEIHIPRWQQLINEVLICWELGFLNLFFYHFLPLLSTNLLILFRILLTIAENFEEVLLTIFITKNYPPHPVPLPQGERGK